MWLEEALDVQPVLDDLIKVVIFLLGLVCWGGGKSFLLWWNPGRLRL